MTLSVGSDPLIGWQCFGGKGEASSPAWPGAISIEDRLAPRADLHIGLCVPLGGLTGIWGPSALASAKLAAAELNRGNGMGGRACRLIAINADDDSTTLENVVGELVQSGEVDALIGMHTSGVRQRVLSAVGGQIPYVYTPLYEGGECTPGVFAIGDTPARQLQPAIAWLARNERPRRWAMLGNDYVWPHVSNQLARGYIAQCGAEVVSEQYVPMHTIDFSAHLEAIRRAGADAVLVSLVGEDAIAFNRVFGEDGMARKALRLSCAIEENELLAIGADNTQRLYVASSYFAALTTDANIAFKERYHAHFGDRAPTLNSLGQSTYEGVHFLASLFERGLIERSQWSHASRAQWAYRSAREAVYASDGTNIAPVYIAVADGHVFRVMSRL
ncbi:substrate-binding domain-containing protein [Variovorax sp. J22R133]|uniref:substrate-binding domain-containing protein n=1 Tax=Variovorax brevis TaxID=3053503 RepID=UPI0025779D5E|nr:substrate-binding domain-containing protein [Variovorax sp. J22R133]MDM0110656.1 substrate-binding domain-containing protein [Variovorax sp. J22R133]